MASLELDDGIYDRLKRAAEEAGATVGQLIADLLKEQFGEYKCDVEDLKVSEDSPAGIPMGFDLKALKVPTDLQKGILDEARRSNEPIGNCILRLLSEKLVELEEDREDLALALESLQDGEETYTTAEVRKQLGLER